MQNIKKNFNILIVFGSTLGKTKHLAEVSGYTLEKMEFNVIVKDVCYTQIDELFRFDLIILGCSTWDDGMLQYDFRYFFSKFVHYKFHRYKFAVFGVGSRHYPHFCASADILRGAVNSVGGKLICEPLKIDLDHDEPVDKCDNEMVEWTKSLASNLVLSART